MLASLQDEATLNDTMKSVEGIAANPATLQQVRAIVMQQFVCARAHVLVCVGGGEVS